jgi:hypothetical protein
LSFWSRKVKNDPVAEAERIRLAAAILEELKKEETVKKVVLDELRLRAGPARWSHNPAVVVVLGFVLTGIFGTVLSIWYQGREWDRQQDLLGRQRSLEQRYLIANETAKAIGEIQWSMMSVLGAMQKDTPRSCLIELRKAVPNWQKGKFEWGVKASVLDSQLGVNFPTQSQSNASPSALSEFRDIVHCYRRLNIALTNMAEVVDASAGKRDKQLDNDISDLITILNVEVSGRMTPGLMGVIGEQLRLNPEAKPSPSLSPAVLPSPLPQPSHDVVNFQSAQDKPCQFEVRRYIIHSSRRRRHRLKAGH